MKNLIGFIFLLISINGFSQEKNNFSLSISPGYSRITWMDINGGNFQTSLNFSMNRSFFFSPKVYMAYGSGKTFIDQNDPLITILTKEHPAPISIGYVNQKDAIDDGIIQFEGHPRASLYAGIDLNLGFNILNTQKHNLAVLAGASSVYSAQQEFIVGHSGTFTGGFDEVDTPIILVIPFYVRFIDVGFNFSFDYLYSFTEKFSAGTRLGYNAYLQSGSTIFNLNLLFGFKIK